jgi:hypothetical protein
MDGYSLSIYVGGIATYGARHSLLASFVDALRSFPWTKALVHNFVHTSSIWIRTVIIS